MSAQPSKTLSTQPSEAFSHLLISTDKGFYPKYFASFFFLFFLLLQIRASISPFLEFFTVQACSHLLISFFQEVVLMNDITSKKKIFFFFF